MQYEKMAVTPEGELILRFGEAHFHTMKPLPGASRIAIARQLRDLATKIVNDEELRCQSE